MEELKESSLNLATSVINGAFDAPFLYGFAFIGIVAIVMMFAFFGIKLYTAFKSVK